MSHYVKYFVGLLRHTTSNMSLDYYVTLRQIFRWIITSHYIKYVVGLLRHTSQIYRWIIVSHYVKYVVGLLRHTTSNMSLDYYVTVHKICR
jgi:hypothetical protein